MSTISEDLPAGWNKIEYIDILKTENFDSGIVPTANMKVEVKALGPHNNFTHNHFFGVWNVYSLGIGASGWRFMYNSNQITTDIGMIMMEYNAWNPVLFKKNGIYNHLTIFESDGQTVRFDGDIPSNTSSFPTVSKTIYIGTSNSAPTYTTSNSRIFYVKIWSDDDVLLRDFIPASNSTEEALYDKVSKQLFHKITV